MTDSTGTTTYSYDALSRLTQVNGPQANDTISYAYNKLGNRIQMTNQGGGITTYTYDSLNRLVNLTDPEGKTTTYAYDSLSNLIQMNYSNSTQVNYVFDNLNRLISLVNKAGANTISSYTYDYNPSGMRTKVTLNDGSYISYSYDALSRLTSESKNSAPPQGIYNATYQYDNLGNRLSYSKTDYFNFSDDFNRANNLNLGETWSEVTGDWQIDTNRLFMPNAETDASIIYPNQNIPDPIIEATLQLETVGNKKGSYIVFSYQNPDDFYYAGLEGISDLWVIGHYQNGAYNDLISLSEPIEKLLDYHIRLSVKDNTAILENFENGSWIMKLTYNFTNLPIGKVGFSVEKSRTKFDDFKVNWQTTTNTTYSYNLDNQLFQSISNGLTTAYVYDKNGNLIQKDEGANATDYTYDYENRLSGINLPNSVNITYGYDGWGRRVNKDINGQSTQYLYDLEDVILEQSLIGNTKYIHGPGIDNPISLLSEANPYYYHRDGLGSITQLTNSTSQPIQSYQYDAFGNIIDVQGNLPNSYAYTGREYEPQANLYYYRNRYYDPTIGRFLTKDPLGMINGPNLYAYVNNNPVNWVDPWGWCGEKPWWSKGTEKYLPNYGAYGGPANTDPTFITKPIDSMDVLFMQHDFLWSYGKGKDADKILFYDLVNLPLNPNAWEQKPNNIFWAILYREGTIEYFWLSNTFNLGENN